MHTQVDKVGETSDERRAKSSTALQEELPCACVTKTVKPQAVIIILDAKIPVRAAHWKFVQT